MSELSGTAIPAKILAKFSAVEDDHDAVQKLGIEIATLLWLISVTSRWISLASKKSLIFSFAPSAKYESAQQISIIISSKLFSTKTLIKIGIAFLINVY